MRLDRLISLGIVNPLRHAMGGSPATGRSLPILMYHSVSDDPEPAYSPYYKVCTSPRRFAEQMQWLAEAGYRGVTLSAGLAWLNEQPNPGPQTPDPRPESQVASAKWQVPGAPREVPSDKYQVTSAPDPKPQTPEPQVSKKLVAITFDDGFRDFHTAAFPALQQNGFSATMYVPTAFIGEERQSFKSRECLTWSEVRELAAAGIEFGSHTVNHPVLYQSSWAEIETELRDSKATLDRQLDQSTRAFAYPFAFPQEDGQFTATLGSMLRSLGYESCTTTIIGRARTGDDPFTLKRLPANSCDDQRLLEAKARGAYDWLALPQAISRRIKRRAKPARSVIAA